MAEAPLTSPRVRPSSAKATVFLGGGSITSALIAGLRLAHYASPILVYDRHPEKLRALQREFKVASARNLRSAIEQAEVLIVAVRPASVVPLLREMEDSGARRFPMVAVSLAAGIPFRKLRGGSGSRTRWARAMPSPVCRSGRGLTALAFDGNFPRAKRGKVRAFFQHMGQVLEIPEGRFDAFTAAFSCTHGYHALAALAQASQAAGLDRETAFAVAAHALADGIAYWRESGESLADLLLEAATPGGTAAAAMAAMTRAGYEKSVAQGLSAAIAQARRNAKR